MWDIRSSTADNRVKKGKLNGKKSERGTNHERLLILKPRVAGRQVCGGWGSWVMGIKEGI